MPPTTGGRSRATCWRGEIVENLITMQNTQDNYIGGGYLYDYKIGGGIIMEIKKIIILIIWIMT